MAYSGRGFQWTVERVELLHRLYLQEGQPASVIARAIGDGCTPRNVTRRISHEGLFERRPADAYRLERSAVSAAANRVRSAKLAGAKAHAPAKASPVGLGPGRDLPQDIQLAIASAIEAGRVTRLPPGIAAGLTWAERAFGAAPPPEPENDRTQAARRRGGRNAHHRGRRRAHPQSAERTA